MKSIDDDMKTLILIAIFALSGVTLVVNGHDEGYWFFVPIVWILLGVL